MTFEEFYTDNYRSVCKYAYRYLGHKQQVEDVAHDVFFLALAKNIHEEHEKPVAWLAITTRNFIKRIFKQRSVDSLDWEIPFCPDDHLWELLPLALSQDEVRLAEMLYKDKMSRGEIAEALGITLESSKSKVRRLKEKIKALLAENEKDGVR